MLPTLDYTQNTQGLIATQQLSNDTANTLNSNIPVIDISQFEITTTPKEFLKTFEEALKSGFFAIVDPHLDIETIEKGYAAFGKFFQSPMDQKMKINLPDSKGQRGFIVQSEIALNTESVTCKDILKDTKEYLHIGPNGNAWPDHSHMNLEEPATQLYNKLNSIGKPLLQAIAMVLGKRADFFTEMTAGGDHLMRALHYYKNPDNGIWAAEHTDIDFLTILPYASEEGLEIEVDGKWEQVVVPKNALVINVGDMLEVFSNGLFPSCKHRVRCTKPDTDRESIVFFIHPTSETVLKPLRGEPQYPAATRISYLLLRLFSLGFLSKEQGEDMMASHLVQDMKNMVNNGKAAKSVELWHQGFIKAQKLHNQKYSA